MIFEYSSSVLEIPYYAYITLCQIRIGHSRPIQHSVKGAAS